MANITILVSQIDSLLTILLHALNAVYKTNNFLIIKHMYAKPCRNSRI